VKIGGREKVRLWRIGIQEGQVGQDMKTEAGRKAAEISYGW